MLDAAMHYGYHYGYYGYYGGMQMSRGATAPLCGVEHGREQADRVLWCCTPGQHCDRNHLTAAGRPHGSTAHHERVRLVLCGLHCRDNAGRRLGTLAAPLDTAVCCACSSDAAPPAKPVDTQRGRHASFAAERHGAARRGGLERCSRMRRLWQPASIQKMGRAGEHCAHFACLRRPK